MKIGITCYPTYGGSGTVATELGIALGKRGHDVHFISSALPYRMTFHPNVYFHEVEMLDYPLFEHQPYSMALAVKMTEVAEREKLEILHVHYAVPHAVSALLAKGMLGPGAPKIVTTLHGTDITLVGSHSSYFRIVKYCIDGSDGVTAVSKYLRDESVRLFEPEREIEVIYNFIDTDAYVPRDPVDCVKYDIAPKGEKIIAHISNFRPVKRVLDVVRIFSKVRKKINSKLLLVGDGPLKAEARTMVRNGGLEDDVFFLGKQTAIENILNCSDVLILPSENESFGLVALEAMSCGVPVVASDVGGIPEVVLNGETGLLAPVGEIDGMLEHAMKILTDEPFAGKLGAAGRRRAEEAFNTERIVGEYERYYERIL